MGRPQVSTGIVVAAVAGLAAAGLTVVLALGFDVPPLTALSGAVGAGVPVAAVVAALGVGGGEDDGG